MTPFLQEGENKSIISKSHSPKAGSFIYRSQVIEDAMKIVKKVAPTQTSVLITGGRGTGKSCLARHIHERSAVKLGPFHSLHCGILSPKVLETELFGFKGDDLTSSSEGALRMADGGTLFLDEITKMPINVQEKFLRFLDTGHVVPVHSNRPIPVQVRIIYSTSSESELTDGSLSKKLYEKINAVHIKIPRLSERREDIPDLVRYFLNLNLSQSESAHHSHYSVTEGAMDALKCYKWSGNVRELKNTCEHLQIFSSNNEITVKDLPQNILDTEECAVEMKYDPTLTLSDINRIYILNALKHFPSKKRAAQALGITVKTLYNRLHEYGIFDRYALHIKD